MQLTAYYRDYNLPWEQDPEQQQRFRKILYICLALLAILCVTIPFIYVPTDLSPEPIPPRLARVMIEEPPKPPPPPPPPPPKVKPLVTDAKLPVSRTPTPVDPKQKALEKAKKSGLLDELADLRQQIEDQPVTEMKNLTAAVGEGSHAERSLISSKVGASSGGIQTTGASRGFGAGAGSLTGYNANNVSSGIINAGKAARQATRSGASGKARRSQEEIAEMIDRNKGAIYSIYNRALRERPELQGKLVIEFTISPAGDVTACRVVSSELKDDDLERKIVSRIKLIHFEAKDVEAITTTAPIDFFPGG